MMTRILCEKNTEAFWMSCLSVVLRLAAGIYQFITRCPAAARVIASALAPVPCFNFFLAIALFLPSLPCPALAWLGLPAVQCRALTFRGQTARLCQ